MESVKRITASEKKQLSDKEVVERVLSGEKELYELLMRRHNQKLFRTVRSYLNDENEAEDAMQDTYLRAYEKLHLFRNDSLFSTWLVRIGINTALGKLRKSRLYTSETIQEDALDGYNFFQLPETTHMNPETIAIQNEVKKLLEKAVDSIPEKYRAIYVLREIEGMSVTEITQCMDLSESNVKVRLHRAKLMLKESLYKFSNSRDIFEFGFKRCDTLVGKVMTELP